MLASLDGGALTYGPNARAFEREFAAWNGNRHAIFTNTGTAALHMGLVACGIGASERGR